MIFTIWKVKYGIEGKLYTYSLRAGTGDIPVILSQDQFTALFQSIDLASIPEAPATGRIEVTACLMTSSI
jgi:hypothetical protein